ncbi:hypothetical protein ATANTOWER_001993 [Ataeniobius toweri]|uniref:Uncharacterized protein n=1 Tax=Ataeniobius toweri TaxID=208326 RepID=A0ABU7B478_9TELE|nr:hypothetical protein [Ataeniobius toweri]
MHGEFAVWRQFSSCLPILMSRMQMSRPELGPPLSLQQNLARCWCDSTLMTRYVISKGLFLQSDSSALFYSINGYIGHNCNRKIAPMCDRRCLKHYCRNVKCVRIRSKR